MSKSTTSKNSELRPIEYSEALRAWRELIIGEHHPKLLLIIDSLTEFDAQQIIHVPQCSDNPNNVNLNESVVPSRLRGKAKYKHEGKYYVRHPSKKHRK